MKLSIEGNLLKIELEWWEKILAFHGSFEIPLSHITSADTILPPTTWKEFKCPGSYIPGIIKSGTYYTNRGKEFWCITRGKSVLQIGLDGERFSRLVLEVNDSSFWKGQITQHKS
jgi:hypothetical protein